MSIFNAIPDFLRSSYEGIDHTLLGNGGLACYDFLTFQTRILDTCVFTGLCFVFIIPRVLRTISLPKEWEIISYCRKRTAQRICGFRKLLLIVLSIVLGIEMAYKLSKKSWIFLLNPCHVVTALQVSAHAQCVLWYCYFGYYRGFNRLGNCTISFRQKTICQRTKISTYVV